MRLTLFKSFSLSTSVNEVYQKVYCHLKQLEHEFSFRVFLDSRLYNHHVSCMEDLIFT